MAKIHVEFDVELPGLAKDKEVEEWLRFELGDNGTISLDNPLEKFEVEPIFGSFDWQRVF